MKKLKVLIRKLNKYPTLQNVRPLWVISSDKSELLYYRMYSDRFPENRISIENAIKCNTIEDIQIAMNV